MTRDEAADVLADVLNEEERGRWGFDDLDAETLATNRWYAAQIVTVLYARGLEIARPGTVTERVVQPTPAQRAVIVHAIETGGVLPCDPLRAASPVVLASMVRRGWLRCDAGTHVGCPQRGGAPPACARAARGRGLAPLRARPHVATVGACLPPRASPCSRSSTPTPHARAS